VQVLDFSTEPPRWVEYSPPEPEAVPVDVVKGRVLWRPALGPAQQDLGL